MQVQRSASRQRAMRTSKDYGLMANTGGDVVDFK